MNSLETDLVELNPRANIVILNFNWEMLSSKQVGRKISYKLKKTTSELYSGIREKKLENEDFQKVIGIVDSFKDHPIYYVDIPGTVEDVKYTAQHFMNTIAKDKWLIVMLDHTLLTKGKSGNREREILSDLQYMFMELKKYGRTTVIQLSQLNRDLESTERLNNNYMHYPMRKDIFGSESIYQASDYVIVLHRPEILNIRAYGPNNWPTQNLIYMHLLKNREGELGIIVFENNLKYNRIDEYNFRKESQSQLTIPI